METALADGDILTFGKAVGAGSCMVLPVTARVELLRVKPGPVTSPSVPSLTPISSLVNLISRPGRNTSGRYGLIFPPLHHDDDSPSSPHSSCYVSSDGVSSVSDDHDSDIEEISVSSLERRYPLHVKIPAFKSFIHSMCRNNDGSPTSAKDTLPALVDFRVSPSPSLEEIRARSPIVEVITSTPNSRSNSPMELSTPSPSPPSLLAEENHPEPAVVGAWPTSRPESPDTPVELETEKDDIVHAAAVETTVSELAQGRERDMLPDIHHTFIDLPVPVPPFFPMGPQFRGLTSFNCSPPIPSCLPGPHPHPPIDRIGNELKTSIKIMEVCIRFHELEGFLTLCTGPHFGNARNDHGSKESPVLHRRRRHEPPDPCQHAGARVGPVPLPSQPGGAQHCVAVHRPKPGECIEEQDGQPRTKAH